MTLRKPATVANSSFRSQKWDEITEGRNYQQSDAPILALLCYWYEILDTCMEEIAYSDGLQVAYENNMGDIKEVPQIGTIKKASAEIRALNKQLGIKDEASVESERKEAKLYVFQQKRQAKAQNTA